MVKYTQIIANNFRGLAALTDEEMAVLAILKDPTGPTGFGSIRRVSGSLNQEALQVLLAIYQDANGIPKALSEYALGILHMAGLGSVLVTLKFLVKGAPHLLEHPVFLGERPYLAAALESAGLVTGDYMSGYCVFSKMAGERAIRPTLFPRSFQTALLLARTEGGSWTNYSTRVALPPSVQGLITALVAEVAPRVESTVTIEEVPADEEP